MLSFTAPLVGMRFRPPAQELVQELQPGDRLLLRRQPDNLHDENAIQVLLQQDAFNSREGRDFGEFLDQCRETYDWARRDQEELALALEDPIPLGYIKRENAALASPAMLDAGLPEIVGEFTLNLRGFPEVKWEVADESERPPSGAVGETWERERPEGETGVLSDEPPYAVAEGSSPSGAEEERTTDAGSDHDH